MSNIVVGMFFFGLFFYKVYLIYFKKSKSKRFSKSDIKKIKKNNKLSILINDLNKFNIINSFNYFKEIKYFFITLDNNKAFCKNINGEYLYIELEQTKFLLLKENDLINQSNQIKDYLNIENIKSNFIFESNMYKIFLLDDFLFFSNKLENITYFAKNIFKIKDLTIFNYKKELENIDMKEIYFIIKND